MRYFAGQKVVCLLSHRQSELLLLLLCQFSVRLIGNFTNKLARYLEAGHNLSGHQSTRTCCIQSGRIHVAGPRGREAGRHGSCRGSHELLTLFFTLLVRPLSLSISNIRRGEASFVPHLSNLALLFIRFPPFSGNGMEMGETNFRVKPRNSLQITDS